ncbi:MAG: hypothetical protein V7636_1067 [Actinomycetota bacterium]
MTRVLRALGSLDIGSGALALVLASWLSDELDLSTATVRIVGVFLVVLGIDKVAFAAKPAMGRVATIVEALFALACIDVAVLGDPTALGTVLLVGTAAMCAAVAAWLFTLQRTSDLVPA